MASLVCHPVDSGAGEPATSLNASGSKTPPSSKAERRLSCQIASLPPPGDDESTIAFKAVALLPGTPGVKEQRRLSAPPGTYPPINTTVVLYATPPTAKEKHDECEDVTEDFIKEFNERRGNADNVAKAWKMLKKTRILAGLEKQKEPAHADIPSARRNFFLLAKLAHKELKLAALDNLITLLQNDEITSDTAFDLIPLAKNLMEQMDRELAQTQLIEEQVKICEAYGIVTELIQRHYAKKHLGGITAELKTQLIQTARTLEDLNTHNDPCLHFTVEYAKEGIKRLKDDRKELFELGERLFHLLVSAASVYAEDMMNFSQEIEKVYQGLDIRVKEAWYDAALLFSELAKKAQNNIADLIILQAMLKLKGKDLDWKFIYKAIVCLGKIAVTGSTPEIRLAALEGQKCIDVDYPGLLNYIACKEYSLKPDLKPIKHFKLPVLKDHNVIIRGLCVVTLLQINKLCLDKPLRKSAKAALLYRLKREHDCGVLQLLINSIPKGASNQLAWVNEVGNAYEFVPPKKETAIEDSPKEPEPLKQIATNIITQLPGPVSAPEELPGIPTPQVELDKSRAPNKVSILLSGCLSLDPLIIQSQLEFNSDIFPIDETRLSINPEGMQQIVRLIVQNPEIKAVDFSNCKFEEDTLTVLLDFIIDSEVNSLTLSTKLSSSTAQKLALAVATNPKLQIRLNSAEDCLRFGSALLKYGLANEALEHYQKGLKKLEGREDLTPLKSKFYYKIGEAELISGHPKDAEQSFQNSLDLNKTSFKTNFQLAKLYRVQSKYGDALKFVEKALEIKPEDPKAQELAAQCRT